MTAKDLGATGKFPEGKLNQNDEGELRFSVGTRDGNVFMSFGKPVAWFAVPPEQAVDLAEILIRHACSLGHVRPISIKIGGSDD